MSQTAETAENANSAVADADTSGYVTDKDSKAANISKGGKNYRTCELLWMCRAWVAATENTEEVYIKLKKTDAKEFWMEDFERVYGLLRDEGMQRVARRNAKLKEQESRARLGLAVAADEDGDEDTDDEDVTVDDDKEEADDQDKQENPAKLIKKWDALVLSDYYVSRKGVALNQRWIRYVRKHTFRFMGLCELEPDQREGESDDDYFERIHSKYRDLFAGEDYSDYRPGWEYLRDKHVFLKVFEKQRARIMTEVHEAAGGAAGGEAESLPLCLEGNSLKRKSFSSDPKLREMKQYLAKRRRVDKGDYEGIGNGPDTTHDSMMIGNPLMGAPGGYKRDRSSDKYYDTVKTGLENVVNVCKEGLMLWQEQQDAQEIRKIEDPVLRKRAQSERAKLMIARMKHTRKRLEAELHAIDGSDVEDEDNDAPATKPNEPKSEFTADKIATL
jgi:hypothetical protein